MKTIVNNINEVCDLSKEQIILISDILSKRKVYAFWDRGDEFEIDDIKNIIFNSENNLSVIEMNEDYEYNCIKDCIKEVVNEVMNDNNFINDDNIFEFVDEFRHYVNFDWDLKKLARNTGLVNIRLHLKSNYDCINSHWLENQCGYFYKESYFGAMVDCLNLNPKVLKTYMLDKGFKCVGTYPNKKGRNGKELVSYENFINENLNSCCGANELVFIGKINLNDCLNVGKDIKTITIPKGNNCGIFSNFQGGGSIFECELLNDLTIDLNKTGSTMYDGFKLELETKDFGYSIDSVYGVDNSFFGNEVNLTF